MDTKQQILDAAEALFARSGYRASSMRAITESAGVNLALANYHFGSKEALLEAVIARRLQPVNEARLGALNELRDRAKERKSGPDIREVIRAYIAPVFGNGEADKGLADFTNLIGRAFAEPDEVVQRALLRHMKPVNQLMLELLGAALPGLPGEEVFWRYQFLIGALGRAIRVSSGPGYDRLKKDFEIGYETLVGMLVSFAAGGMKSPQSGGQVTGSRAKDVGRLMNTNDRSGSGVAREIRIKG